MAGQDEDHDIPTIDTGGGASVGRDVNTNGGNFAGRDLITTPNQLNTIVVFIVGMVSLVIVLIAWLAFMGYRGNSPNPTPTAVATAPPATHSPTPTESATVADTPTISATETPTPTMAATWTPTLPATSTSAPSPTDTPTPEPSATPTPTATETPSPVPPTATPTHSPVPPTLTPSPIPLTLGALPRAFFYPTAIPLEGAGPVGATMAVTITDSWGFSPDLVYTTTVDAGGGWALPNPAPFELPGAYMVRADAYLGAIGQPVDTAVRTLVAENPCAPPRTPDLSERPCLYIDDADHTNFGSVSDFYYVTMARICTVGDRALPIEILYVNPTDQSLIRVGSANLSSVGSCNFPYESRDIALNKARLEEQNISARLRDGYTIELIACWPIEGDPACARQLPFVIRLRSPNGID